MDISGILNTEVSNKISLMKMNMINSALNEIGEVATKVAETGDPAYILELSPLALAMFKGEG